MMSRACGKTTDGVTEMSGYPFYIVDVFAEKKYAGNQLAVFRNAGGISHSEMQTIAREMNFSETTFILSDEQKNGGFDVRIFTPQEEVPFAGHPTIGTAFIIHEQIIHRKIDEIILNLQVGQIPVTFSQDGYYWMRQIQPTFGKQHDPITLADILGLKLSAIDARFPIQEVSTGLPFFIVPLNNLAALERASINKTRYLNLIKDTEAKVFLFFVLNPMSQAMISV